LLVVGEEKQRVKLRETSGSLDGKATNRLRILAICSGGGHWMEMMRLRPAFEGFDVAYATVNSDYRIHVGTARFYRVTDASRWSRMRLILLALGVLKILLIERPAFVISTGAAPGFFALMFGKWLGVRTIWLDSAANAEKLSMAGSKVGRYADLWLTQWPDLARPLGPEYAGSVL
jgi:exopolysaccharide biosynthesis glucuronosyltransferase PssD